MAGSVLQFPEWRPDAFPVGAQLNLVDGVRPEGDFYVMQPGLATAPTYALPERCLGAMFYPWNVLETMAFHFIAGTAVQLYQDNGAVWTTFGGSSILLTGTVDAWSFSRLGIQPPGSSGSYALAAPSKLSPSGDLDPNGVDDVQYIIGTFTDFIVDEGGDGIQGKVVAGVGQFGVLGHSTFGAYIRWSNIADPTLWTTPNTAGALAAQAGEQFFPAQYGPVNHIAAISDRAGLVFQQKAIHMMTYIGGDLVWQFDTITTSIGARFVHANVSIGSSVFFLSDVGFHKISGGQITHIGLGRVDNYFRNRIKSIPGFRSMVHAAHDEVTKCIYWLFPGQNATTLPQEYMIYNYASDRWSTLLTTTDREFLFSGNTDDVYLRRQNIQVFDTAHKRRQFTATTPLRDLTIDTGEENLNPGGRALVNNVRPLFDLAAQAGAGITVYSRDDLTAATAAASTATYNARARLYNCRADGRYHQIRCTHTGLTADSKVAGLEVEFEAAGQI